MKDNNVVSLGSRGGGRPEPMRVVDLSDLDGKTPPRREWVIESILVKNSITLFGGDGGVGKSLACQMLQVCAGLGIDWLGLKVPQLNSFGVYCEDDEDELHRRFDDICNHFGYRFKDLDGRVRYVSRVGEENELVQYNGRGDRIKPMQTPLMQQIRYEVKESQAQLVILDTAGDVFGGNENVRNQVRSFVNIIRGLALVNHGGVILTAHPSKASMVDGSNFSGSTAWHGSCRNRIFLTKPKRRMDEGEEDDGQTDDRVLKIMKSNYGPGGGKINCVWQKPGVFVDKQSSSFQSQHERLDDDRKVLKAAEYLIKNGAFLSADHKNKSSLACRAREIASCKDIKWKSACDAVDRLKDAGKLVLIQMGPPTKRRVYVRPSSMRYPGEREGNALALSLEPEADDSTGQPT